MNTISAGRFFNVNGYAAYAYRVNHTVPAVAYVIIDRKGKALPYTGDTGPTDAIWKTSTQSALLSWRRLLSLTAWRFGNKDRTLTPKLLKVELAKMKFFPQKTENEKKQKRNRLLYGVV